MQRNAHSKQGFTMIEILMTLSIIALLSIAALPKLLDLRKETRAVVAQAFVSHLKTALVMKKTQLAIQCQKPSEVWPRLESIMMNDITEGGSSTAYCTPSQIPNNEERKFLAQGVLPAPVNPYNNRSDIAYTTCTDLCNCSDEAGYLYNPQTGDIGQRNILEECHSGAR